MCALHRGPAQLDSGNVGGVPTVRTRLQYPHDILVLATLSWGNDTALAALSAYVSGALVPGKIAIGRKMPVVVDKQPRTLSSNAVAVAGGATLGVVSGTAFGFGAGVLTLLVVEVAGMGAVVFVLWLAILGGVLGAVVGMGIVIRKRTIRR